MGQAPGRLQTILPWRVRSPNLACKMRQRHAARVQRPHGQTPEAIRPDSEDTLAHPNGHTAESPRTRSRNSGRQLCNHGAWYRYRTGALWLSETVAGRTLTVGSDEPTGPTNIHVVESPGGASHRAPAPGPGPCSNTGPAHSRNQISRARPCSSYSTRRPSRSESFAYVGW